MHALISAFEPYGRSSGGFCVGSSHVDHVLRSMSMSSTGLQRVAIAHSTWLMFEGSTSSSTATIHLAKYAPPGHCGVSARTCGACPAKRCPSDTIAMPHPPAAAEWKYT